MLSVWFDYQDTIVPHFPTGFSMEFPYDPQEIVIFILIGVVCGLGGALYVFTHRTYGKIEMLLDVCTVVSQASLLGLIKRVSKSGLW